MRSARASLSHALIRNDRLQARVKVSAVHAPRVRVGKRVDVQSPGGNGILATGAVSFVDPNVVADTKGLLAMSEFQNPGTTLRKGTRLRTRGVRQDRSTLRSIWCRSAVFRSELRLKGRKSG